MEKKFYITTSIAYANAPPHIGFALELIQADVIARYYRLLRDEVFFLTGTDEHGAKVAKAAKAADKTPQEFTDEISNQFRRLTEILNISNNDFIRTTDQRRHWPTVRKVWLKLRDNDDIYKKQYKGLYCSGCEAFITKKDLKEGKCVAHQKEPEIIEEENYFFRLSRYSKRIEKNIAEDKIKIIPKSRKNEILNFVKQGLEDISFSRPRKDLKWAIPVPDDDKASVYVWTDALTNYLSALGYDKNSHKFKEFWPADIHFIGKDILKFHGAIWPGMLLSLKLALPKTIFVHGFINVAGQKMSKSLGNIVDPFELVEKYGTDAVRYFLLREIQPTEDGDFTYEKFEARYNSDLAKGLGNLVARSTALAEKFWEGIVPKVDIEKAGNTWIFPKTPKPPQHGNYVFKNHARFFLQLACNYLSDFQFNEALKNISGAIGGLDKSINDYALYDPSKELNSDKVSFNEKLYAILEELRIIALVLSPFLPETAGRIFERLGIDTKQKRGKDFKGLIRWGGLEPGTRIEKGESLFPRI